VVGLANVLLACAYAVPDSASAATAAINEPIALSTIRSSKMGLEYRRSRSPPL
jgi:hypothetical protein